MVKNPKLHIYFWSATFLLLLGFVFIFKSMLTPFVLGTVIAYLLNPIVNKMEKLKISRFVATVSLLLLFFVTVTLVLFFAIPPLYREAASLAENIPDYIDQIIAFLEPYLLMAQEKLGADYSSQLQDFLKDNSSKVLQISGGLAGGLAVGGQAVAGLFTTIVLTPLVAFFMMREWPAILKWFDDLIPRKHEKTINGLTNDMDAKISGFIRGQITVAFFLGVIYAISLTIAGLNYGFLIGISAGVLSIIPLVGSTIGLIVSVVVAWFQLGEWSFVAIIAAIFFVGQIVEGNFLTPKLVGDSVGLHPLWVLFSLMAGGSLFGILGMLIAVPVTAVVGVLLKFGIAEYKDSELYTEKRKKSSVKKTAKKTVSKKKAVKA